MHIVKNSQTAPLSEPEGECRSPGLIKEPGNLGYKERRDTQHELVWDQERARITFAEMPSAEETALSRLFAKARANNCEKLIEAPPLANSSSLEKFDFTPISRVDFSQPPLECKTPVQPPDFDRLVGLETLMHMPSFEQLLRTTSYKMLEAQFSSFKEIPVNESKRFDVGLQKVVDSADRAATKGRPQSMQWPAQRCQAYFSTGGRSSLSESRSSTEGSRFSNAASRSWTGASEANFGKLRGLDEHCAARSNSRFGGVDPRDVLQNIWNRFVAKKNASLMLEVMQRKMRIR